MKKHILCSDNDCYLKNGGRPALHTFQGMKKCETGEAMEQSWACDLCGHEVRQPQPRVRCHKRTWPYHNDSAGVTFESESHEQAYCKANKLTPINA